MDEQDNDLAAGVTLPVPEDETTEQALARVTRERDAAIQSYSAIRRILLTELRTCRLAGSSPMRTLRDVEQSIRTLRRNAENLEHDLHRARRMFPGIR